MTKLAEAPPDDVAAFLDAVPDEGRRADSWALLELLSAVTKERPYLRDGVIVGFGHYRYAYASGREGEGGKVGFAPRKTHLTLYLISGLVGYDDLLRRLGRHKAAKAGIHFKRLTDLDLDVLRALVERSLAHVDQVVAELGGLPRMSEMPPYRG